MEQNKWEWPPDRDTTGHRASSGTGGFEYPDEISIKVDAFGVASLCAASQDSRRYINADHYNSILRKLMKYEWQETSNAEKQK